MCRISKKGRLWVRVVEVEGIIRNGYFFSLDFEFFRVKDDTVLSNEYVNNDEYNMSFWSLYFSRDIISNE